MIHIHYLIFFIAHDLPVVKDLADRVLIINKGVIIEQGDVDEKILSQTKQ